MHDEQPWPAYKKIATTDHVKVAEKLRADLDKNYPSLKEAAIDVATLEKALVEALANDFFRLQ